MTTLSYQIPMNVFDAMNTSDNPRFDKEDRAKKHFIPPGLRRAKRIKSTTGVGTKNWKIILVGISLIYKNKKRQGK